MSRQRQDVAHHTTLETLLDYPDLAGILETKLPLLAWRNLSSVTKTIRSTMVHSKIKHFPSPKKPYAVIDGKLTLEDKFRPLTPLQIIKPDSTYNVKSIDIYPDRMCLFCDTLDLSHCHDIKYVNAMLYLDDRIKIINNLDLPLQAARNLMFNAINSSHQLKNRQDIITRFEVDYKEKYNFEAAISRASLHRPYAVVLGGLFWDHSVTLPPETWTPEPDETVRSIFTNAVAHIWVVKSMNLSNFTNLRYISFNAFGENEINELVLPDNLLFIGTNAFKNARLTKLVIPDKVESIKDRAFENSKLVGDIGLSLTSNLQDIGADAFKNARLTKLVIPNTVESIGSAAFHHSTLRQLDLSKTEITHLPNRVFADSLLNGDGVEQPLKLPPNLQTIGECAFYSARLTQLVIPNTVEDIQEAAFHNSTLGKLDLSKTKITNIGPSAFFHSLLDAGGDDPALLLPPKLEKIGSAAFFCAKLKKINHDNKFPRTVKEIGAQAFETSLLEELDLSKTQLEEIRFSTFEESPLQVLKLPNSKLTGIERKAFRKARLTSLTIPENVIYIQEKVFEESPLQSLIFDQHSKLTKIYDNAFKEANLKELTIPKTVQYIAKTNFAKSTFSDENTRKRLQHLSVHPPAHFQRKRSNASLGMTFI